MKNLLKSLLLAASVFMLLAGCNQIGVSDATVDGGAAYTDGVSYLTVELKDFVGMASNERSAARTINPISFEGTDANNIAERAKLVSFVLEGTSESTGADFSKTLVAADFKEVNVDDDDPSKGKKQQTKVAIPYGAWELTLTANDSEGNALLQGKTFANVKTANSEAKFTLKTDGLDTPGSASIKVFFEDEGSVAKFYKVALYDLVTAERKYPSAEPTYTAVTAGTPADPSNSNSVAVLPSFEYKPTNVAPGRYSLQVSFYTSNDDDTAKKIGYWEDILEIAPGRETKNENIVCGKIINQKPKSPKNLRAYYKVDATGKKDDSPDGYTVILTWDDESNNEENFVITIDEYEEKEEPADSGVFVITPKDDSTVKLDASEENAFFASKYYAGGSVRASSTTASVRLPHGKYFEISIQAENFVGLSDADAAADGVQACTRVTTTGVTPAPTDGTLITSEKINRYAINYDLGDGTLTLMDENSPHKGIYSEYGSIYDSTLTNKTLSTVLLNTAEVTVPDPTDPEDLTKATKKRNVITSLDGYAWKEWVETDGVTPVDLDKDLTYKGIDVKASYDNKTTVSYTIDNKYYTISTAVEYDGTAVASNTVTTTEATRNKDLKFTVTPSVSTLTVTNVSVKISNAGTFIRGESATSECTVSTKNLDAGNHTVVVTAVIGGKKYQNSFPLVYIR